MSIRYYYKHERKTIVLLDCIVVLVAIAFAYFIRAQYSDVLFTVQDAAILFPWLVFLRIFSNNFFEHYSISLKMFDNRDMMSILKHGIVPSAILILFRILSPYQDLRMPFSMIMMEYCFSMLGFIAVRLHINNYLQKSDDETIGYRKRIILYGEVRDIERLIDIEYFCTVNRCEIVGIFTSNPLFWQNELQQIRVYGDETKLRDLIASDDRISEICLIEEKEISEKRRQFIDNEARGFLLAVNPLESYMR